MRILVFVIGLFIICSSNHPALAEQLSSFNISKLNFNLVADNANFKFLVKPTANLNTAELTANTFVLKNPYRLVIDVPGFTTKAQKKIELDNNYLSSIRVGKHRNKIRTVVDIKPDEFPEYDIYADEALQSLVVEFSFNKNSEVINSRADTSFDKITTNKETLEKKFTPSKEVINTKIESKPIDTNSIITMRGNEKIDEVNENNIKTIQEIETKEIIKPEQTAKKSIDAVPEQITPKTKVSTIKNILFQVERESGALVIEADKIGEYEITQKGKNLYELVIQNSRLSGEHLTLPQFPPNNFKNFEVILTNQLGENSVQVKIYLNSAVELEPSIIGNKLWIYATSN